MKYSLFVILDCVDDLNRGLQPYNLSEETINGALKSYTNVLKKGEIPFKIEHATSPSVFKHRASDLSSDLSEDWDVSVTQVVHGVRKTTKEFIVLIYEPKTEYINRLSGYLNLNPGS